MDMFDFVDRRVRGVTDDESSSTSKTVDTSDDDFFLRKEEMRANRYEEMRKADIEAGLVAHQGEHLSGLGLQEPKL